MVKLLREGVRRPRYYWMERQWRCGTCDSVVEFEEGDAEALTYEDSQKDGESIQFPCPLCQQLTWFYPVKKGEEV